MTSNLGCIISVGAIGFVLVKKVAREMWVSIVTTCTVGSFHSEEAFAGQRALTIVSSLMSRCGQAHEPH